MGARESLNERKNRARRKVKNGEAKKSKERREELFSLFSLFSPFFTFLRALFFHPFRLSLSPTICPWVSEGGPYRRAVKASVLVSLIDKELSHYPHKGRHSLEYYLLIRARSIQLFTENNWT